MFEITQTSTTSEHVSLRSMFDILRTPNIYQRFNMLM